MFVDNAIFHFIVVNGLLTTEIVCTIVMQEKSPEILSALSEKTLIPRLVLGTKSLDKILPMFTF